MPNSPVPDLVMATMGTFLFLIFGTQRDILRAWACTLRLPHRLVPSNRASVVTSRSDSRPGHQAPNTTLSPGRAQFSTIASLSSDPHEFVPAGGERKVSIASDVEDGMGMELGEPVRERGEKDPELGLPMA
jgi:hypothetical protein